MRSCVAVLAFVGFLALMAGPAAANDGPLTLRIATGNVTGVYYSAGNAICRVLKRRHGNDVRCEVLSTSGTGSNVELLARGGAELAMAQSDFLLSPAPEAPSRTIADARGLTALAAVYPEVFQVVARRSLKLARAGELLDYRVNVGVPRSGTRLTLEALMAATGQSMSDFKHAVELSDSRDLDAFCRGQIDGFAYISGVPNGKVALALEKCDGEILGFVRRANAAYVRATPGIDFYRFRRNTYREMSETVDTFAIWALLVARPNLDQAVARLVVQALRDDLAYFSKLHPAWANVTSDSLLADVHPTLMNDVLRGLSEPPAALTAR